VRAAFDGPGVECDVAIQINWRVSRAPDRRAGTALPAKPAGDIKKL